MADERLSDEEVSRVLRRASELDAATSSLPPSDGLPVAAVEAAAAEVGVSPAAVRLAVAELRTGALDDDGDPVVCARVVPGDCPGCLDAVGRWLRGQALVRARERGTEQVWRPREDWVATLQRRFDWAAAIRLRGVDEVVVRAVEVEGGTLVRVCARLEPTVAAAPKVGAGAGAATAGLGLGGLAVALTGDAALVTAVAAGPAAVLAAAGGWRVGRRVVAGRRARIAEAVDGLLDELELGRRPGATAVERLAARARRLRSGDRV